MGKEGGIVLEFIGLTPIGFESCGMTLNFKIRNHSYPT